MRPAVWAFLHDALEELEAHLVAFNGDGPLNVVDTVAAISVDGITEVLGGGDDPCGRELATTIVLAHPDVVFPGGDCGWFGAYDRAARSRIEIYTLQ